MANRTVDITPAHIFFEDDLPYFVNRVKESYELQLHEHEFTEVCYVGEGAGFHYIGEHTIPVSRGDLFLLPLGTSHVFRPRAAGVPLVVYNFIFIAERVAEALRGFPGFHQLGGTLQLLNLAPGRTDWRHIKDAAGVFHTFFTNAHQEFRLRLSGFVPRMHALFIILLTEIDRHLEPSGTAREQSGNEGLIAEAIAFVQGGYASAITANQAARVSKISERHFHRLFAKATGFTFNEYLQNVRIERSCELLRSTRLTMPEIAEAVGYQDKGYFLKLFKKKMGQTPRAYRNGEAAVEQPSAGYAPSGDGE